MRKLFLIIVALALLAGCAGGDDTAYNYSGTVTSLTEEDDSYGTPYLHLTVEHSDGHTEALLLNTTQYPLEFEVGGHYRFLVEWQAARGNLILAAEPAD